MEYTAVPLSGASGRPGVIPYSFFCRRCDGVHRVFSEVAFKNREGGGNAGSFCGTVRRLFHAYEADLLAYGRGEHLCFDMSYSGCRPVLAGLKGEGTGQRAVCGVALLPGKEKKVSGSG